MRTLLFWGVCLPVRWHLATLGDRLWLRAFAGVVGARWVLGLERGRAGFFGGPAWWAEQRGAHGVLWLAYAASGERQLLQMDTAFGALNWFSK